MNTYRKILAAIFAACFMTISAFAADASPTGTWKWTQQGRQGGTPQERSVTLELKDGKLTGQQNAYTGPQGEIAATPIKDATFKDGTVAFTVEISFGENKFAVKYAGKVEGDTIKGQVERPGFNGGDATKSDWTATRAK